MSHAEIVQDAVSAAGGPLKVAYEFGYDTDNTVRNWIRKGKVPAECVVRLLGMGGNKYRPEEIRPDVFTGASS